MRERESWGGGGGGGGGDWQWQGIRRNELPVLEAAGTHVEEVEGKFKVAVGPAELPVEMVGLCWTG